MHRLSSLIDSIFYATNAHSSSTTWVELASGCRISNETYPRRFFSLKRAFFEYKSTLGPNLRVLQYQKLFLWGWSPIYWVLVSLFAPMFILLSMLNCRLGLTKNCIVWTSLEWPFVSSIKNHRPLLYNGKRPLLRCKRTSSCFSY